MRVFRLLLLLPLLLLLWTSCDADTGAPDEQDEPITDLEPTVILLSIDGLRWDYLDLHEAPTLSSLREESAFVERLVPVFPTKTFPNHYSLVTGLHPSNHGIISNTMYDAGMDERFSLGNDEAIVDPRWWEGEPIWVTAVTQGQNAATYFWPGSEVPITEHQSWPEDGSVSEEEAQDRFTSTEYDGSIPGDERVDQVLEWLDRPREERPNLITLYFSEVDSEGHSHGPESEEVGRALAEADGYVAGLLEGLRARGIDEEVHLLITSDHGMSPTSQERVVLLDDYIDLDDVHVVDYDPVAMIDPVEGRTSAEEIIEALSEAEHVEAFHRNDLPERLHFQDHHRIPEVIVLADDTWRISTSEFFERDPAGFDGGAHGYDPALESMHTLLIARGPAFEAGSTLEELSVVDLYEVMTAILSLDPAPNDGNLDVARGLFREGALQELDVAAQ